VGGIEEKRHPRAFPKGRAFLEARGSSAREKQTKKEILARRRGGNFAEVFQKK